MKKNITLFLLSLMMTGFIFVSCKNTATENTAKEEESCKAVNPDSLVALWNTAWNTKNLEALKGMIADSAIVIDHDWYVQGKDSLFSKWINSSLQKVSDVTTTPLKINTCCCCVAITGLYTLNYKTEKGETVPTKGNFTFIWTKAEDGTYKLQTMHLTEFHGKDQK